MCYYSFQINLKSTAEALSSTVFGSNSTYDQSNSAFTGKILLIHSNSHIYEGWYLSEQILDIEIASSTLKSNADMATTCTTQLILPPLLPSLSPQPTRHPYHYTLETSSTLHWCRRARLLPHLCCCLAASVRICRQVSGTLSSIALRLPAAMNPNIRKYE